MHVSSISVPGKTCWQGGAEVGAADVEAASTPAINKAMMPILICCVVNKDCGDDRELL